jgi:hypothetical protein
MAIVRREIFQISSSVGGPQGSVLVVSIEKTVIRVYVLEARIERVLTYMRN